jgi:hypothetical protein
MLRSLLFLSSLIALAAAAAPKVIRVEAEAGAGLSDQIKVLAREDASGGSCVQLGVRGGRNDEPKDRKADATFSVQVPWGGQTVVWGRVLARNGGTDSVYAADPKGEFHMVSLPATKAWVWTVLRQVRPTEDGTVTLRLQYREPGALLDEVVFASRRDLRPDAEGVFRRQEAKNPYAEPPFLPPNEHPRVFLRRQHIPALRAKLTGALRAELEKQADQKGDGVLPAAASKERGNFSKGVGNTILANAYVGLLDGDDTRRQRAVDMFGNYFRTVEFAEKRDVTRDYGLMLMTGGLVYDWCYDLLTPEWKKQFIADALDLASIMEIRYPPTRQSAITSHAGEAQLLRDQLVVGIAVYDEFPEWYRIGAGRFFQEFVPARNFFFPSHRHHQGESYGPYRFQWSMSATWLFDRMGAGPVFTAEQGKVPYSWLYTRRPDGQLIRDGDTFLSGEYWRFPLALMLTASYYSDPYLEHEYRRQIAVTGRELTPLWRALFHDPELKAKPPLDLPLTKFFAEPLGAMVARTGWRQGAWSGAVVCEMKGAGYHFNNHHHLDAGGFQIYYRGGLATDAGCYGHYGIPYDWHWNKRSIAHNTLLLYDPATVDATRHDGGQNYPNNRREPGTLQILKEKGYKDGSVLAHAFGPDPKRPFFSHIKTDLTPGYADRAKRIERSCVFLNLGAPGRPAALVTLDRIVAAKPKLKPVWLLHSVNEPTVSRQRATIMRVEGQYGGQLVSDTLLPRQASLTTIGSPTGEAKIFGQVFEADRPTAESGGWRIEVSPTNPAEQTVFLHALQVGDADGKAAVATQTIQTGQLIGARIGDEAVLFARDGKSLAGPLDLTLAGKGPVRVVLTDLAAGFWGTEGVAHQAEATTTGGAICLRLAPGKHRLVRSSDRSLPEFPQDGLLPPAADALAPEVIDGSRPLSLRGVIRETAAGPLVDLKLVAEAFGGEVAADTVTMGQSAVTIEAGKQTAICNGEAVSLARPAELADGHLLVGLDGLSLALRRPCRWDATSSVVVVDTLPAGQIFIQQATASHSERRGSELLAIDRNNRTYWAAKEDGAWLQLDLGVPGQIRSVGIDWLHSEKRRTRFEILASLDGKRWGEIFAGQTDGQTPGVETVNVPGTQARYLRIVGHGNDSNHWNSIREITVWTK